MSKKPNPLPSLIQEYREQNNTENPDDDQLLKIVKDGIKLAEETRHQTELVFFLQVRDDPKLRKTYQKKIIDWVLFLVALKKTIELRDKKIMLL